MELYILDNNDLSTLSILECSNYEINLDNQFTDKSTFRVNKAPGQIKNNFLVVNGLYQQFLFIINEVEATDKEEKFVNLICSDISNVFNRKIIQKDTNLMTSRSIEYFLAHMIDENFINSDDSFLNKSYVEVTYYESTQAKEATNAENGIYNFHTFMENCREHHNVFTDFKFEDNKLKVTIKHKEDTPVIIDTTLPEVTHYNKVYEQDITAKVQVYVRENDTVQNYYLKTDRTITTDKNDPNRASGAIEVISVETEDDALQEATNVFRGNTYKHLVEFSMSKNSKLVDTTQLYICRAITIKTPDGIYNSIISGISLDDDNFINFKSGNIRINFIDKLKQEKENYGDKLDVTGGVIKGNLTTQGNQTISGKLEVNDTVEASFFTPKFYILDLEQLSTSNFYPITFPKKTIDLPLECEIHSPNLGGAQPYNQNVIRFRSLAGGWSDTPPVFNVYEYGVFAMNEITIGCIAQNVQRDPGTNYENECVWLRGGLKYRFVSNFKPVLHTENYTVEGSDVVYSVGTNYYGGTNIYATIVFTPQVTISGMGGEYLKNALNIGNSLTVNGTIGRSFDSSTSATMSETDILAVGGGTDGFRMTYEMPSGDLGVTRLKTIDDANARLELGNNVGGTYKRACWVENGKFRIDGFARNTTDTWIPVLNGGALDYAPRQIWNTTQHTNWNNNQDNLVTLSCLSFWNGAYDSYGGSNLQYSAKGKIPRMRSSAQIVYKRQSYNSPAWGKVNLVANSSKTVGSDFVISGNAIKVNNGNVNRVKVTLSISGAHVGTGTDLYFEVIANGAQTDVYYNSYNPSYGYWASGGSMTYIADVSNGSTIYARGGTGAATTFEPINTILVVEDVSVW